MKLGVLGTGIVGQTIATKLAELEHDVMMGSRAAGNEKAVAWASSAGSRAREGSFADAASFGQMIVNATAGHASLDALHSAGAENLAGKIIVDIANPLDFSAGMPPTLTVCNDDSLGEQIQRAFPDARVVKTLNTLNAGVMVSPRIVPGEHQIFTSGNDADAKQQVAELLVSFGWPSTSIVDLGDISSSRGTEMYVALWIRLYALYGTGRFNISLQGLR